MRTSIKPLWISPNDGLEAVSRSLGLTERRFNSLMAALRPGEILTAVDMGYFRRASVVTTQEAFNELYEAYSSGWLTSLNFYATNEETLTNNEAISIS